MTPYLKRLHEALNERGFSAPPPHGTDLHPDAHTLIKNYARRARNSKLGALRYQTDDASLLAALRAEARTQNPDALDVRISSAIHVLEGYEHVLTALSYDTALAARLAACLDAADYPAHLLELYTLLNAL